MFLRKRKFINYCEDESPTSDNYVYCTHCDDYVYEYCSLHGPLLVIPDDQVSEKKSFYPPFVPRAALTIPQVFLHIAPSVIPWAGLGVFTTLTLPRGVRFGPYEGEKCSEAQSVYCWQVFGSGNQQSHVIDATNPNKSNWMRYVNCSRHWLEQNLVAYQYRGKIYYRTIKTIPKFTELLVFYGSEFAHLLNVDLAKYNSMESPLLPLRYTTSGSVEKEISINNSNTLIDGKDQEKYTKQQITAIQDEINIAQTLDKPVISGNGCYGFNTLAESNNMNKAPFSSEIDSSDNAATITSSCKLNYTNTDVQVFNKEYSSTIQNENQKGVFKCSYCSYTTKFLHVLTKHSRFHDFSRKHICPDCGNRYTSASELKRHRSGACERLKKLQKEKLSKTAYLCDSCGYKTSEKSNLARHLKQKNKKSILQFQCRKCSFVTKHQTCFIYHSNTHRDFTNYDPQSKEYFCKSCGYRTSTHYNLVQHLKQTETASSVPFQCKRCDFVAKRQSCLMYHLKSHRDLDDYDPQTKEYFCNSCGYRTSTHYNLVQHLKQTETASSLQFQCQRCDFVAKRQSCLMYHSKTHRIELLFDHQSQKYLCHFCNFTSYSKQSTKRHLLKVHDL